MKEREVIICLRLEAESQDEAEKRVEKWLGDMSSSIDNLPSGLITGGIVKKNPPSNGE